MESNNRPLGDDMPDDVTPENTPDAEETTADAQDVTPTEQPAEIAAHQAEPAPAETTPTEDAPVGAVEPVAEVVTAEPEPEALEPAAEEAPPEAVELAAEQELPEAVEPAAEEALPEATQPAGEQPAEEPESGQPQPAQEAEAEQQPALPFKRGDIITGRVTETSPTEVLVDLGEGIIGVVASRELERMDREALEALQIGSDVTAYVLKLKGSDGRPVLSLARAEEESNWRLAEEHYENKKVYFSKVAGYNKGGLIVRFGKVRGFVPASQVSRERQRRAVGESPEERWGSMVGDDIAVKVVEIDRARNRLILSERAAAREWREHQKSNLLEDLQVGDVRTGRVISVADFGAFVDLGGADGLVHLTELSWQHVTHPREVVDVGQEVEVEVINIDRERKRIGLSMKRQAHDPWQEIVKRYHVGQLVQATVTKLTKFGAFARLVDAPEIEGLIHISELADYRVTHPKEVVLVGDVLTLRIVKIEPEQRRLGLSLRQVDSAKYMDQDWEALADDFDYSYTEEDEGEAEPEPEAEAEFEPTGEAEPETAVEAEPEPEAEAEPNAPIVDEMVNVDVDEITDELGVEDEGEASAEDEDETTE